MKIDVSREIRFQTARSGGKGGQNVNKVETMVAGYFTIRDSQRLTEMQKERLLKKLSGKLNSNGELRVKSQAHRSQLQNKADVIRKINTLLEAGLKKEKKRIATKASKASVEKRLDEKKKRAAHKRDRRKPGQEAE